MPPDLTFNSSAKLEPGTVYSILATCFAEILDDPLAQRLQQFDREVAAGPDTVGACTFVSTVGDETVGLVSYDPRQGPRTGIIGYNGVLPSRRHQGYGRRQIQEIARILTAHSFESISVTTSLHPFFEPARRMYEACGFCEVERKPVPAHGGHDIVLYQMDLCV